MKNFSENNGKPKGFTLVELIVVIAIIGILASVLVPSIAGYIEKAKNTADISNARQITNALQIAIAISPDTIINHDNPWDDSPSNKDHGYVYVDDNEVRVSNIAIADILEEEGIIKNGYASKYKVRQGKEATYSADKVNVLCKSRKKWQRYQVNFVFRNGGLEFSYSATKTLDISKDAVTSEKFANMIGGQPGTSEISLGGKN